MMDRQYANIPTRWMVDMVPPDCFDEPSMALLCSRFLANSPLLRAFEIALEEVQSSAPQAEMTQRIDASWQLHACRQRPTYYAPK
jgi:hypothetical protein